MSAWKDIGQRISQAAPTLGALLGGPAGRAVGVLIGSALGVPPEPDAISAELERNPDALVKLRQIEKERQVELQGLAVKQVEVELGASVGNARDVNTTMQAEAKAETWPQYTWRPAIGFSVAIAVILTTLTVFVAYGAAIFYNRPEGLTHLPGILAAVAGIIGVVSPILGIASWFRGKQKMTMENPSS